MIQPVEHIAQIWLGRSEDGRYSVLVRHADGTEVDTDEWRTISAALESAGRHIAEELLKRRSADDPRGQVP